MKAIFPRFLVDGTIHVLVCGSTLDIPAADGPVAGLFDLLDGTQTVDQIHRELAARHPDLTRAELDTAIAQLDAEMLVEDAGKDVALDDYSRERWHRDRGFFETYATLEVSKYELQERVQGCAVALLGLGGVGSHILLDLLGLGVRDIRVVDFDKLELSNLNRQVLYRYADIGRRKVEAATEHARAYQPRVRLDPVELRMASPEDVASVVADRDVVIAAVDQPKMHIANWVNAGCVRAGATLLTGGVDLQRSFHYTVIPGRTGCVACWLAQAEEKDPADAALNTELRRIQASLAPSERFGQDYAAFGPLVAAQAACLITEFVRIASGIAPPVAAGRMMELRIADFQLREAERWERLPDCDVCRTAAPASAPGR